ncbi:phosphate ABC transporter substrate-binding protein [Rheinheimera mesophila]|uniref:Phosphate ABC transporter substrate-binding protein n=1 Tax=Rheinheimera mesophila TaxID=1547515 RepID=A0A3P3QRY6_9GAMM|nr:phosphate ABC transporter substrate-binding protein [Rheinheimera mesophila]KKL03210.1 phosphate ABC transporter substrate-binding protein [Rheinheimera mesophila]RRJ23498.1 phosphate ABC transporter substrate-binding protein [Rheinheimera mesophila]
MLKKLILIPALALSFMAAANVAVIVHPSNAATLSQDDINKLFTGRAKTFTDGKAAEPVNLAEAVAVRADFDQKALGRSSSQMKAYWSKLVFTGKGTPPKELASEQEVLDAVAKNPAAIGYVSAAAVTGSVKVALTLN